MTRTTPEWEIRFDDFANFIQEQTDLAYKKGEEEGQARMNNSGRLMFQNGYETAVEEVIGTIPNDEDYLSLKHFLRERFIK